MDLQDNTTSAKKTQRLWTAAATAAAVAGLLAAWGIYGIGLYGIALFMTIPLFIGAGATLLYGYQMPVTAKDSRRVSFLSLAIFAAGLLVFALEGLICIVMAAPIGILLTWIGSLIGLYMIGKAPGKTPGTLLLLIALVPLTAFVEKDFSPALTAITTAVEIDAPPQKVWEHVVEFPPLEAPEEFIFKTGIAYPVEARIEGAGAGAVRHCLFNTGSFVEPVTVWDEPRLLQFDVMEQPVPMREISFWDVDAPHLHDYFVSRKGQFKLTALPGGKTLLEGTTWYYHDIRPAFYWRLWSDYIVHKIHKRVLNHIKTNAEE